MTDSKGTGWEKIDIGDKPDVLITFAGMGLTLESSHAWAAALAAAMPSSAKSGVGTAFAVAGPNAKFDPGGLVKALAPHFAPDTSKRIHVVAHSSGVTPSNDFLEALAANKDAKSAKRLCYYFLDGGDNIIHVKKHVSLFSQACAVSGQVKVPKGKPVQSRNYDSMVAVGKALQGIGLGKFVEVDLGAKKGSEKWPPDPNVLHMALVNFAKPVWKKSSKDSAPHLKGFPSFYPADDLNSTYLTCKKDNVTADYIK